MQLYKGYSDSLRFNVLYDAVIGDGKPSRVVQFDNKMEAELPC